MSPGEGFEYEDLVVKKCQEIPYKIKLYQAISSNVNYKVITNNFQ